MSDTTIPRKRTTRATMEELRDGLRQEILDEEFNALTARLGTLEESIDALKAVVTAADVSLAVRHNESTNTMMAVLGEYKEAMEAIRQAMPDGDSETERLRAEAGPDLQDTVSPPEYDDEDSVLCPYSFLDFEEISNMISAAIVARKPLQECRVRVFYNPKAQRELLYNVSGVEGAVYGLDDRMHRVRLVQELGDENVNPYVRGTYVDGYDTVTMSEDQVARILDCTLNIVTPLWRASLDD